METNNITCDIQYGVAICRMHPVIPRFTDSLLTDLEKWAATVIKYNKEITQHWLVSSDSSEIFSLGGDLEYFIWCINNNKYYDLMRYAGRCVALVGHNLSGFRNSIVTISHVAGLAYGGGFEAAVSSDYLIKNKNAKFMFPEYRFGFYPGMGAKELLGRLNNAPNPEELAKEGDVSFLDQMDFMQGTKEIRLVKRQTPKEAQKIWDSMLDGRDKWVKTVLKVNTRPLEKVLKAQEKLYYK